MCDMSLGVGTRSLTSAPGKNKKKKTKGKEQSTETYRMPISWFVSRGDNMAARFASSIPWNHEYGRDSTLI